MNKKKSRVAQKRVSHTKEESEVAGEIAIQCYLFSDDYDEARACVRRNVSNRKLVSDTTEVMEAALNCMLWISDLKLFTTCVRRNIEDPVLANRFIREFKKELKKIG
ncbi:hypothetical protein HpMMM16_14250 [Helicobacter pylori]